MIDEGQPFRWLYTLTSDRVVDADGKPIGCVFMTPGATTPAFVEEVVLGGRNRPIWFPQDFTVGPGLLVNVLRMSKQFAMLPVLSPRHFPSTGECELVVTHDCVIPAFLSRLTEGVLLDQVEASLPLVTAVRRAVWRLVTADETDAPGALAAVVDALDALRGTLSPGPVTRARLVLIRYAFLGEVSQHPALIVRRRNMPAETE